MQCFRSFHTAERTIEGMEAAHMMRKGQVKRLDGRDSIGQARFVASLFGVAARRGRIGLQLITTFRASDQSLQRNLF
jgi:hypothetical protein